MSYINFAFWFWIETVKYILLMRGFLGYSIAGKRGWGLFLGYYLAGNILVAHGLDLFYYKELIGFVIGFFIFKEKILMTLKASIWGSLVIDVLDLFLWSIFINIFPELKDISWMKHVGNSFGIIAWGIIVLTIGKYRHNIHDYFEKLSFFRFVLLNAIFLAMGLLGGALQANVEEELSLDIRREMLLVYMTLMMIALVGSIILVYTYIKNIMLTELYEREQEIQSIQKKYYEEKMAQNEELRSFRHDVKKHMKVMKHLNDNENYEELKRYINDYLENCPEQQNVHTGNMISDYFIGETIDTLSEKEGFSYQVIGKFPESVKISNTDMCILMANALENAKNALVNVKGACQLRIEVKNYNDTLFLTIENTKSKEIDTTPKRPGHGYGIKNMKTVINKYQGEMRIKDLGDIYQVKFTI